MIKLRNAAAVAAIVGAILVVVGAIVDPSRTAFAYLVAYAFGVSIAVCALVLLMIGWVTDAKWMIVFRRLCEAIAITLPLFVVLFLPIALLTPKLYLWAGDPRGWSPHVAEVIRARGAWHRNGFFFARSAFYLLVWCALAVALRRIGVDVRRPGRRALGRSLSGAGLPAVGLTLTFAAWDWMMSTDPAWSSNIYGLYVFAGGFLAALSLTTLLAHLARARALVPNEVSASHFHALGNLMLAMTIFWAWMAYAQLVVLWITDIPEESGFYATRWSGFWRAASWMLVVGHFFAPLFLLLQRSLKRDARSLAWVGVWLVAMHYVDVYWLLVPVVRPTGVPLHWVDLGALLFVGGAATAFGAWRFAAASPVPDDDPALAASLEFEMS